MKNTPLIDGLKKYIEEGNIRLHMPGHKGRYELEELGKLIPYIDMTEVPGVDNLHNARGIIAKSQKNAARVFKAKQTLYSVNGTTAGIYAAITSQTRPGEKILIARDSHKAVYQSLVLGNLDCDYLYPKYDRENNILTGIDPEDIEEKLKQDDEIKAVVINYPSYYGICSDIENIVEIVHRYDRLIIVDEAHGSHLAFHPNLPKSALEAGADISIQSTHKTLPAFTQSSMVHIGTERVDREKLKLHMSIYQTTSPSYILMASLDYATDYMDRKGQENLDGLLKKINEITRYLEKLEEVEIYTKSGQEMPYDFDITKFLFKIKNITGTRLESILREDYHIQVEMSDHYYCLALMTPLDELENLEKLKLAIEDISKNTKYKRKEEYFTDIREIIAQKKITSYKAFYSDRSSVQLKKSIGEISAEFITPYPPGIPILVPGEIITEETTRYIERLISDGVEILGIRSDKNIKIISKDR